MSEKFIELFETARGIKNKAEDELWFHLSKCVGNTYKYTNSEGITFYIGVEYFRGFDKIGVNHINQSESVFDEWDVEEFYEIIKDSVEIG